MHLYTSHRDEQLHLIVRVLASHPVVRLYTGPIIGGGAPKITGRTFNTMVGTILAPIGTSINSIKAFIFELIHVANKHANNPMKVMAMRNT